MFTGLVAERGHVARAPEASASGGVLLELQHSPELGERLCIGASLAVSGVCLTVVELAPGRSVVELSPETLRRSTLGALAEGSEINLETPLRVGDPLGGHWVQGHVDTTTELSDRKDTKEHRELDFAVPVGLEPYLVEKGSVAIDGVSLTVTVVEDGFFGVALIPHTLEMTTLGQREIGDRVNLEVDILAKYAKNAIVYAAG